MENLKTKILKITAFTIMTLFMSTAVFAQVPQYRDTLDENVELGRQSHSFSQEQNQMTNESQLDEGVKYSEEIDKSELPEEVTSSVEELYPVHEIEKVYRGEDDSYKIKLKNEDEEAVAYYNSEGEFLRGHNLADIQTSSSSQEQSQRTQESPDQEQWQDDSAGLQQDTLQDQQNQMDISTDDQGIQEDQMSTGTGNDDTQGQWNADRDSLQNEGTASPQDQYQRTDEESVSQQFDEGVNYSEEIDKSELPQAASSSLDELYPAHEVVMVNRGEDDSYKVKVKNEDDEAFVYYDAQGDFLRAHNLDEVQQGVSPQEQNQRSVDNIPSSSQGEETEYRKEIDKSELPQAVTSSLDELYPAHKIVMVNRGDDDSFKVKVKNEDDEAFVYYDAQGDFLRAKSLNDMQQEASPQDQAQRSSEATVSQDQSETVNYSKEIDKNQLPQQVTSSLDELYPAHEIVMVNRGDDDSFKVKVKNEDDEAFVYYNAQGDFLRAKNLDEMQQEASPQSQSQQTIEENENQSGQQQMQQGEMRGDSLQGDWDTATDKSHQDTVATPQEQYQRSEEEIQSNFFDQGVDYSQEIDKSELPQEVTSSIDELYPVHEIEKAYRGNDDSYKIKVKDEEDVEFVYYSSDGTFLRAHNTKDASMGATPQEQNQRIQEKRNQDQWNADSQENQEQMGTGTENTPMEQDTTSSEWESQRDTLGNEGAAVPQEQNQRTENQDEWMKQGERTVEGDWDTSGGEKIGSRANRTGSKDFRTEGQYGTTENDTSQTQNEYGTTQVDTTVNIDQQTSSPQEQMQRTTEDDVEYSEEIQKNELPETITNSLDALYPDHEIEQVFRGEDGSYKVKINNNQEDKTAVYYNSNGLFLRTEDLSFMKSEDKK